MKIRVIAGKYKGRKLAFPLSSDLRPTKDSVKEAAFSIIGENIENANFLDLFAGIGSIGIEAASRGASKVTFVDNNVNSLSFIYKNTLFVEEEIKIINENYKDFLIKNRDIEAFDIVYIDPPYEENIKKIYEEAIRANIVKKHSIIVLESSKNLDQTSFETPNSKVNKYKFGKTFLYVIKRSEK
ncbi:MAG: 16S rRNA (guanine(966)-N(2))-methyltransferase RsmD [Bacilli bacterium]|jgi:16S rRNA (guanine966-N2)-methyltransferase